MINNHKILSIKKDARRMLLSCKSTALVAFSYIICLQAVHASSYVVPLSCESPGEPARTFYVDPLKGSMSGDGSADKPWKTFAEVVSSKLISSIDARGKVYNPKGIVKPGDRIYLRSGNHGSVSMPGYINPEFITVAAAPGEKPVLQNLTMSGGTKWVFEGLTFEDGNFKIRGNPGTFWGPSDNIIFTKNTVISAKGGEQYTPEQWMGKERVPAVWAEGTCITISNNDILFSRLGISTGGNKILAENNNIEFYTDDGIRFYADNLTLRGNKVLDHYGKLSVNGNHNDGIQGWIYDREGTNLVIDSNIVIEKTGKYAEVPLFASGVPVGPADYIQGISVFDGIWKNITVTNNVIAASAGHGLSFYGIDGGIIVNNTVVSSTATPLKYSYPWIGVFPRKDGVPSSDIIVRNNIGNFFSGGMDKNMKSTTPSITADHNIKIVKGFDPTKIFVKYDPSNGVYDLRPLAGGPAVGTGKIDNAPLTDITGKLRLHPVDLGAYAFDSTNSPPQQETAVFTGTLSFKASARQNGSPTLMISVNDKIVERVPVRARINIGELESFSIPFSVSGTPKSLSFTMEGYTGKPSSYSNLGLLKVNLKVGNNNYDLMKNVTSKSISFTANGQTSKVDLTGLPSK